MGLFDNIFTLKNAAVPGLSLFDDSGGGGGHRKFDLYGGTPVIPELEGLQLNYGQKRKGQPMRDLVREISIIQQLQENLQPRINEFQTNQRNFEAGNLADIYRNIIGPLSREQSAAAATSSRESDMADFLRFAPQYLQGRREADPLFSELYDQATQDVAAGSSLTPRMRRDVSQNVLAALNGRGMSLSPFGAYQEALATTLQGEDLRNQRLSRAGQVSSLLGDPFQAITGRPSQALGFSQNAYGQAASHTPSSNPFDVVSPNDVFNTNINAYYANLFNRQNINAAEDAANKQLFGSIVGGALGGASSAVGGLAMCWVAREVFGERDPRWTQFREWVLLLAPAKFREWYRRNGQTFAAFLKAKPRTKAGIARWMERRIAEWTAGVRSAMKGALSHAV